MRKHFLWIIAFIIFPLAVVAAQSTNPKITEIINQVNIDSLKNFVEILSGEIETMVDGSMERITNRYWSSDENDMAADYIQNKLSSFGLAVYNQNYSGKGRNVYAVQPGDASPDSIYIICAHYDNVNNPGADDNASGTAAVIEAARILSGYSVSNTIYYALFDQEESGLVGSGNFAQYLYSQNLNIAGVINLDMIAYDSDDDGSCEIHVREVANSVALGEGMKNFAQNYSIDLLPEIILPGSGSSDQRSFWNYDYSALFLIEEYYGNDFNQYYHTPSDLIDKFNFAYFENMSKMGIGYLASLAGVSEPTSTPIPESPTSFVLQQNYPNPFNPETIIEFYLLTPSYVDLTVYDVLGKEFARIAEGYFPAGLQRVRFNYLSYGKNLSSGVYLYKLMSGRFSDSKKMLLAK